MKIVQINEYEIDSHLQAILEDPQFDSEGKLAEKRDFKDLDLSKHSMGAICEEPSYNEASNIPYIGNEEDSDNEVRNRVRLIAQDVDMEAPERF